MLGFRLGSMILKVFSNLHDSAMLCSWFWKGECFHTKNLFVPSPSRRLKDLAALEGKQSLSQSELVVARETLEEWRLQRDLLKREKQELTMALEKVWSPYS